MTYCCVYKSQKGLLSFDLIIKHSIRYINHLQQQLLRLILFLFYLFYFKLHVHKLWKFIFVVITWDSIILRQLFIIYYKYLVFNIFLVWSQNLSQRVIFYWLWIFSVFMAFVWKLTNDLVILIVFFEILFINKFSRWRTRTSRWFKFNF